MEHRLSSKIALSFNEKKERCTDQPSSLINAQVNKEYIIKEVKTDDEELRNFLFTLGCYEGEKVAVMSVLGDSFVISVKDARYSIDKDLAEAIIVQ